MPPSTGLSTQRKLPSWLTKEVWGWAAFDFANQAFTIVILTTMFQVYFTRYIVPGRPGIDGAIEYSRGILLWSQAGSITKILIILTSPLIGALADFTGTKKRLLFVSYVGCVGLTLALGLVPPGAVALGLILFVAGNFFYSCGENLLSAFLPELAEHRDMGKVSAFSFSLAYVGALMALAVAVGITWLAPGETGLRWATVWAAFFFLAAGAPTFFLLRERKQAETLPPGQNLMGIGFVRLAATFRELREYIWLFRFIVIMTIYNCGVQVVLWFSATITQQFGFSDAEMGLFMLQLTITAIIGAVAVGNVQDRIGTRNTIIIMLAFWAATITGVAFTSSKPMLWIVGNGVGIGIGGLGTATRVMVGLFSPSQKAGEFFGFYGVANNLAAIIGLSVFGWVQLWLGEHYFAVAVGLNAIYFIIGIVLMFSIDEKAGRIAALRMAKELDRRARRATSSTPAAAIPALPREVETRIGVYLDNNATTRPDPDVVAAVTEALSEGWANPSSVHRAGQAVRRKVELAREEVCKLIGCEDRELIFTSGGTEGANLAIVGSLAGLPKRPVLVTSRLEHSAVRETAEALVKRGTEVIWAPSTDGGIIDLEYLSDLLARRGSEIALVSIMWVNNETGVIQPIERIGAICREHGVRFHTDATQWVGRMPTDLATMPVDLASFAAHKFHGPKGIGGLFIRRSVRVERQVIGGPQERDRRGGTENVPGIVGMGVAAQRAREWCMGDGPWLGAAMRDQFQGDVLAKCPDAAVNGVDAPRIWTTTNIGFPRLEAEAILLLLSERGVYASAGAACSSGSLDPSPVLLAMGVAPEIAHGSIRFSFSRETTASEIEQAAREVAAVVDRLRRSTAAAV